MVNTNGVRIAGEPEFAKRLATYMPNFERYLQFDSVRAEPQRLLRGADLTNVRRRAIDRLNEFNVSTTLVVTLKKGLNDDQIGEILEFAVQQPCIRGVTFQPIPDAGRVEGFNPATDRLTLGEVRQQMLRQFSIFSDRDIIPVPCHPDCLAMGYALKTGSRVMPLTGLIDPQALLAQVLCCLPQIPIPDQLGYDNIFRMLIVRFLDAYSMDIRSVEWTCAHIVHPDGRIIPFDT